MDADLRIKLLPASMQHVVRVRVPQRSPALPQSTKLVLRRACRSRPILPSSLDFTNAATGAPSGAQPSALPPTGQPTPRTSVKCQ